MKHEKNKKRMLVPKWRFPEFRDSGEWSTREFKDLIEIIEERAGTKKYTLMSVTAGEGLVSQIEKFGREIAGNAYKNYYVIQRGNFAYNKSATKQYPEGYIAMLTDHDKAALPNSIFTCFRITDENTCPKIFDHMFHANYHGSWLRKFIAVGARAHGSLNVDTKHLLDMPVVLPSFFEQQKIADCLSSLDELITAEADKLEAYKSHKRGLMQKLFPSEGETVPEWRFPEFRGKEEWEERTLGRTATIVMGASPKSEFYNEEKNGLPLLQGNADIRNRASAPRIFTSQITKECLPNDILLSVRAPVGTIAKSIHHACIGRGIAAIRSDKNNSQEFLYQWLFAFETQWQNISQGGTFDAVNSDEIRQLLTVLPKLKEQQKIADCLSSLDKLITAQTQKIETLKTHKKGLMQGLFPSADEVNA